MAFIVPGAKTLATPCPLEDKWNGDFKFARIANLPCGCKIYVGDLQNAQDNQWSKSLDQPDTPFTLSCACGKVIYKGASRKKCAMLMGWAYLF